MLFPAITGSGNQQKAARFKEIKHGIQAGSKIFVVLKHFCADNAIKFNVGFKIVYHSNKIDVFTFYDIDALIKAIIEKVPVVTVDIE
jgi:hypothetical protein